MPERGALAVIAGAGRLPALIARSARKAGRSVHVVALQALSDPAVGEEADSCEWLQLGEFARMLESFARAGAREIALAGKVPKAFLWQHREAVKPDARALGFLAALKDRKDDSLLGAIAELLAAEGYALASQLEVAPELVAPAGVIAGREPSDAERADIAFGFPIARALGGLDVGQSVVVQGRAVLALEAIEGTDAAIARGLAFAERGRPACVVKVAKPNQDPRFDVPAVGPDTVRALAAGGGSALAVEAGRTLVVDRDALAREAEAAGIAVSGVDERSARA
jgi:DUF1009 family protein